MGAAKNPVSLFTSQLVCERQLLVSIIDALSEPQLTAEPASQSVGMVESQLILAITEILRLYITRGWITLKNVRVGQTEVVAHRSELLLF